MEDPNVRTVRARTKKLKVRGYKKIHKQMKQLTKDAELLTEVLKDANRQKKKLKGKK